MAQWLRSHIAKMSGSETIWRHSKRILVGWLHPSGHEPSCFSGTSWNIEKDVLPSTGRCSSGTCDGENISLAPSKQNYIVGRRIVLSSSVKTLFECFKWQNPFDTIEWDYSVGVPLVVLFIYVFVIGLERSLCHKPELSPVPAIRTDIEEEIERHRATVCHIFFFLT